MNKPRILFVTKHHLLKCIHGGSEERCWLLSTELTRRGWDVHYASEMNEVPQPGTLEGVRLHGLREQRSPFIANRRALRKLLYRLKPDVVFNVMFDLYTRNAMLESPPGTLRVWASAAEADGFIGAKLKLIRQNVGLLRFYAHFPRFIFPLWMARKGVLAADLVIAQHEGQRRDLEQQGIKSVVLHNPQIIASESEMQTHHGRATVLWVGGIKSWKRPSLFIELARHCRDLDADFVMIGSIQEPPYRRILESAIKELPHFRYDGVVPHERVGDYFRKAHVLVSTSQAEGYPNTFIHAMMRGVPIVSLDVNPEGLLTEKGFGRLVADSNSLETAVRELVGDPQKRREIGARAREYAAREFDLKHVVDRLEELLEKRKIKNEK